MSMDVAPDSRLWHTSPTDAAAFWKTLRSYGDSGATRAAENAIRFRKQRGELEEAVRLQKVLAMLRWTPEACPPNCVPIDPRLLSAWVQKAHKFLSFQQNEMRRAGHEEPPEYSERDPMAAESAASTLVQMSMGAAAGRGRKRSSAALAVPGADAPPLAKHFRALGYPSPGYVAVLPLVAVPVSVADHAAMMQRRQLIYRQRLQQQAMLQQAYGLKSAPAARGPHNTSCSSSHGDRCHRR